ncbi:MAG: hypothetical protein RIS29_522 [Bacteroidota bacterium]|jgi:hypothetical protein
MLVFLFLKWKSSTLQCKITSKHNTALKRDKALKKKHKALAKEHPTG